MQLKPELLRGVFSYGFESPSYIQKKGIVPIINGRDLLAQAQSGTGKTATFVIGLLQRLDVKSSSLQALILVPTRELAQQIERVLHVFAQYMNIVSHAAVGGVSISVDKAKLINTHIVVGTPGRVCDLMSRNIIVSQDIKIFVMDEADEMLDRGFDEEIKSILRYIPENVQTILLSATMPSAMHATFKELIKKDAAQIFVKDTEVTLDGIKQYYINCEIEDNKTPTLIEFLKRVHVTKCVMFCNSKKGVESLAQQLTNEKFDVSATHSGIEQKNRELVIKHFRHGSTRYLITTDLLSRGIDVQQVNLVINYDIPHQKEVYIHRIGRSGRFGRKGTAVNLLIDSDSEAFKEIKTFYNTQIEPLQQNFQL